MSPQEKKRRKSTHRGSLWAASTGTAFQRKDRRDQDRRIGGFHEINLKEKNKKGLVTEEKGRTNGKLKQDGSEGHVDKMTRGKSGWRAEGTEDSGEITTFKNRSDCEGEPDLGKQKEKKSAMKQTAAPGRTE